MNVLVDILALIVAVLALIVAVMNYNKYKTLTIQYNSMVNVQTLTAQGALETQIRSAISEVTHDIVTLAVEVEKNSITFGPAKKGQTIAAHFSTGFQGPMMMEVNYYEAK